LLEKVIERIASIDPNQHHPSPDTFWWKQAMRDREINATLIRSRLIESVFNTAVAHHAYRSDVPRLEVLLE
jgi:hypothetical protein